MHHIVPCSHKGQKKVLDPVELELRMDVTYHMDSGNELGSSATAILDQPLSQLILQCTLFCFPNEETEAEKLSNLPEGKRLTRSKTGILNSVPFTPLLHP